MMVRKAMAVLQPSPRDSPWKALSKEDLEKQYSPSRWSHRLNAEEVIKAHVRVGTEATKEAQASKQSLLGVAYGEGDGEKLDIYFPAKTSEELSFFLFIHGGYWQEGSKDYSAFMVPPLTAAGVAVAVVAYDLAPKGNVDLMLSQVKHSVLFIQKQYSLNREDAQRNSPMFCQKEAQSQVTSTYELIVAVGQHDSPEFLRQSLDYFQTLRLHGWRASFIEISNVDHFDIIEKLIQKEYILTQVILKTIFQ
ncbi:kynurenine formamidase isoform X4 [Petaurus breviceps papuanus]|uniref:kynurenine formamidase isoform X4 n=1 Tax=Petaurus breviceps papuanus TaxID=3040969 RepID=UPI0036D84D45